MKKIPVKTLYLLLVIGIGLIGLGIGSTYAMFTTSAEISNPISLNSNLTYTSDIIETIEVDVPAGKIVTSILNITNSSGDTLNYTAWYLDEGNDLKVGVNGGNPTGTLTDGNSTSIKVAVRNDGASDETVILGISSNASSVVLGNGMIPISNEQILPSVLIDRISYLYKYNYDSSKSIDFADDTGMNYYAPSVNLMNDGLDSSGNMTNDPYTGNIRYYGSNPNNYIYFNCDNYDSQSDSTCEKWRIIGIVDGKVKIVRDDPIGTYSWDYDYNDDLSSTSYSNDWVNASLRKLLNESYYGNEDATYYNGYPSTALADSGFKTSGIGIKDNETKMMISESTWYINKASSESVYANSIYKTERTGNSIVSNNIGLLYPSDYGYATDLNSCNVSLNSYNASACKSSNWMKDLMYHSDGNNNWLIAGYTENTARVFYVTSSGTFGWRAVATGPYYIYPTVYLDTSLSITSNGDGSEAKPYQIDASSVIIQPGLYETGTYKLIKSWDELVSEGVIVMDGTTVTTYTGYDTKVDLVISDDVTAIGDYAFDTLYTDYSNVSSLTGVTIGNNVISIGDYAFNEQYYLKKVIISDSVKTIGEYAFGESYRSIDYLELGSGLETIGDCAFTNSLGYRGELIIPNGVKTIGVSAFAVAELESLSIPKSVTFIGEGAFSWCDYLTKISFGHGESDPISIDSNAFDLDSDIYENNFLETTVISNNDYILNTYDWAADSRVINNIQ